MLPGRGLVLREWSCRLSGPSVASFPLQTIGGVRAQREASRAGPRHIQDTPPHNEKLVLLKAVCSPQLKLEKKTQVQFTNLSVLSIKPQQCGVESGHDDSPMACWAAAHGVHSRTLL